MPEPLVGDRLGISVHTPLAGSDVPLAGRVVLDLFISIHTPLAGSDKKYGIGQSVKSYFNPHSPCGERPSGSKSKAA